MKYLNQFIKFDISAFLKGKLLVCVGTAPWNDYTTKELLGTKLSVVISEDHTEYRQKPGENHTNQYEKFNVKVPKVNLDVASGTVIELTDSVATVYGEYRNQLSVTASDIRVIQPAKA